jgi:hypothetical protein
MKQNGQTHAGPICATDNGASIYIEALRNREKRKTDSGALMYADLLHAGNPAGNPLACSTTTHRSTTGS